MSSRKHVFAQPLERSDGLRSKVVDHLIAAIFNGQLAEGDRLIVQRLAEQLGISATPVREALVELESLGFVEIVPNRGAICRRFGRDELRELYRMRRILEVEATRTACANIPEAQLIQLRRLHLELRAESPEDDTADWSARVQSIDLQLHELIHTHCGSNRLCHEIERYGNLMSSFRRAAGNRRNVQIQAIGDHLALIDALLAGDVDRAARCMAEHIENTAVGVERVVFDEVSSTSALSAQAVEAQE